MVKWAICKFPCTVCSRWSAKSLEALGWAGQDGSQNQTHKACLVQTSAEPDWEEEEPRKLYGGTQSNTKAPGLLLKILAQA